MTDPQTSPVHAENADERATSSRVAPGDALVCCGTCGLVQRVPERLPAAAALRCARCDFTVRERTPNSLMLTAALSIAALFLFVPANVRPIVEVTKFGATSRPTIFDAVLTMMDVAWPLAILIFVTSILTPAVKIVGLLFLVATIRWTRRMRLRTYIYKIIRVIDPWNMMEILLISQLVTIVELGQVASVFPGPGIYSFAAVVVLTILASETFDERLIWDDLRRDRP